MKLVKDYMCDDIRPTDEEILECIDIANKEENCIVRLNWYFPYSGKYKLEINKGDTFEECKSKLPKSYPV